MFETILNEANGTLSIMSTIYCMTIAVTLGIVVAYTHMVTSKYSKNFIITLCVLPLAVQVVIMMVNGNLGTSVAILGAFSLVRFRSLPGNSREIASVFVAMAIGLAVGMGYLVFAVVVTLIICIFTIILSKTNFGEKNITERKLKIKIPESLDYEKVFDDIFNKYTNNIELEKVRTTDMGSLYELTYSVLLKKNIKEKELLDELRCRNGNLNIILARPNINETEL